MKAAKLEGVHSELAAPDCGLRQPTSTLTPANATVPPQVTCTSSVCGSHPVKYAEDP
jgi:hypothetical protein